MIDISNKLHAMVDEFVSNLTSECDQVVNTVSAQGHMQVPHDRGSEATRAPRLSNRTAKEVLNGLRRPTDNPVVDVHGTECKSILLEGNRSSKDDGRISRQVKELRPTSASVEGLGQKKDSRSVDILADNNVSKNEVKHGRRITDNATKGNFSHTVEILSSDQSSEEYLRPSIKSGKKIVAAVNNRKVRNTKSAGRSIGKEMRSPVTSPESSHRLNYSYEDDLDSLGTKNPPTETSFPKLRWPEDVGDANEDGGTWKRSEVKVAKPSSSSHKKPELKLSDEDTSQEEGDESNEEDVDRNANGADSDVEELPVLPKVPVKRKLMSEPRSCEKRAQKGRTKSSSPPTKKQRTPQIDASVITKLEFGRRPQNSVSYSKY